MFGERWERQPGLDPLLQLTFSEFPLGIKFNNAFGVQFPIPPPHPPPPFFFLFKIIKKKDT